jgi:hypothetical protein
MAVIIREMPRGVRIDQDLLEAALVGYRQKLQEIEGNIEELKRRMGGRRAPAARGRELSPEARARIAEAQRKRWEAFRRKSQGAAKATSRKAAAKKGRRRPAAAKAGQPAAE